MDKLLDATIRRAMLNEVYRLRAAVPRRMLLSRTIRAAVNMPVIGMDRRQLTDYVILLERTIKDASAA